jgi:hypothetical protein
MAFCLELLPLLLALSLCDRSPWSERLALWRRSRSEIAVQLRMGDGLLPWMRRCGRQMLIGAPDTPAGVNYRRLLAELADAEHRMRVRLGHLVMPEQLRQSILSCAASLVGLAEASSARLAVELEQQTLTGIAAWRAVCRKDRRSRPF